MNQWIDTALSNNFDLITAWERLKASQAIVSRQSSALYPGISSSVTSGISFPQPDFVGGENVRLGISADYELDLWGRISSQVEAAEFRAEANREDYQTAALSLAAEIARVWFALSEAQTQRKIIQSQIEINQKSITSLKNRFERGLVPAVDILRQQQLLRSTQAQEQILIRSIATLEHQLAILCGHAPQTIRTTDVSLPDSLPALPATGLPTELIQRRPDLRASFRRLQATDRDLATAISNKYPRLSLSASSSLRANEIDRLWESWAYSFTANLFAPLFNWGQLNAEVDRFESIKQQRLFTYGQNVLFAFQEVEDALVREQTQRDRLRQIRKQLTLAEKTYRQLRLSYFNGDADFLDVLTAQDQFQRLERTLVSERRLLLEFRISLYRALAGGIEDIPFHKENES